MMNEVTRRTFVKSTAALALMSGGRGAAARDPSRSSTQAERGARVFLDYDQAELDAAYDQRVWAPNRERVQARRRVATEAALERLGEPERLAYGPTEIERLDWYRTDRPSAPIHVHIHGGAWRAGGGFGRAADTAEAFVRAGAHFVAPDYVLVQDTGGSLLPLADQVRRAVVWVYRNATRFGGEPDRVYLSGHSAGAHLAGVALTTDWPGDFDVPADIVKGGLCSSGMFDLYPVSLSSRREYVAFDDATVEALSPIRHLDRIAAPLIVSHGTAESPEFQRQSRELASALDEAGEQVTLIVGEGYNHFEMPETLGNPFGLLGHAALSQMGLAWN